MAMMEKRTAHEDQSTLSEVSVAPEKLQLVGRTARAVSDGEERERVPVRFDVAAIGEFSGQASVGMPANAFDPRREKAHWKIRRNHRNAVI